MKNKDLEQFDLNTKIKQAMQSEDENAVAQVLTDFADNIQQSVLKDVQQYKETGDQQILQRRGVHTLTQEEKNFYQKWINAAKSENPKQALTNLDIALPFTVIDNVISDLKANHPLLDMIDFQNMTAVTKMLFNKQGKQLAVWGKISEAITKELSGTIGEIDVSLNKLTAFLPISKDMLDVGPTWIDAYVRAVLSEAVAYGLEEGIINGNGKDQPIGMIRDIHEGVTVSTETGYPEKTAIKVTDFSPKNYGSLVAKLAVNPYTNKPRTVAGLTMITNPTDYLTKVMPATTVQAPDGTYKNDILPLPTTITQSEQLPNGKAILGMPKKYAMGLGSGSNKGGKIQYSDEYKFLEDQRYYITKLTGNGRAYDNNCFIVLDISELEPLFATVNVNKLPGVTVDSVKGTVATKEQS